MNIGGSSSAVSTVCTYICKYDDSLRRGEVLILILDLKLLGFLRGVHTFILIKKRLWSDVW